MVAIKFISQMRNKVKKGETLTTTEKMLVAGHKAWQFFAPARTYQGSGQHSTLSTYFQFEL
jgi:hypothetical protein